jgi:hypothetical protein
MKAKRRLSAARLCFILKIDALVKLPEFSFKAGDEQKRLSSRQE